MDRLSSSSSGGRLRSSHTHFALTPLRFDPSVSMPWSTLSCLDEQQVNAIINTSWRRPVVQMLLTCRKKVVVFCLIFPFNSWFLIPTCQWPWLLKRKHLSPSGIAPKRLQFLRRRREIKLKRSSSWIVLSEELHDDDDNIVWLRWACRNCLSLTCRCGSMSKIVSPLLMSVISQGPPALRMGQWSMLAT